MQGAQLALGERRVDFVEVEAGMNRENTTHVSIEVLKHFLEENGYFLFGVYDQVSEWPKKEPHLRRVNAVFVSDVLIGKYGGT